MVSETGATIEQIRTTLSVSLFDAVYKWDSEGQSWEQTTEAPQQGDIILVRISGEPTADTLSELNLQKGTPQATLTQGWNIITLPETITRTQGQAFLLDSTLVDCTATNRAVTVTAYKPQTKTWGLWIPCNSRQQTTLTTGQNPAYETLNTITPADITYIYYQGESNTAIAWDATTKTYQTAI